LQFIDDDMYQSYKAELKRRNKKKGGWSHWSYFIYTHLLWQSMVDSKWWKEFLSMKAENRSYARTLNRRLKGWDKEGLE
jgi:hypothetical protein